MANRGVWSPRAIDDVDAIAAYIAEDSEAYAASVVRKIIQKTKMLANFPKLGRMVPEFGENAISVNFRLQQSNYLSDRQ